jgi:hypothetical protein
MQAGKVLLVAMHFYHNTASEMLRVCLQLLAAAVCIALLRLLMPTAA